MSSRAGNIPGFNEHVGVFNSCTECHDTHALEIVIEDCAECHEGADTLEGLRTIRMTDVDYDGDGDVTEGVYGEIDTMRNSLQVRGHSGLCGRRGGHGYHLRRPRLSLLVWGHRRQLRRQ